MLKLDVYNKKDRTFNIKAPRWFSFERKFLTNETIYGSMHYQVFIEGIYIHI